MSLIHTGMGYNVDRPGGQSRVKCSHWWDRASMPGGKNLQEKDLKDIFQKKDIYTNGQKVKNEKQLNIISHCVYSVEVSRNQLCGIISLLFAVKCKKYY